MKKMRMKRALSSFLAFVLAFNLAAPGLTVNAYADETSDVEVVNSEVQNETDDASEETEVTPLQSETGS